MCQGIWPAGAQITWGRTDQGIDGEAAPGTQALAIGAGTVQILHDPSGFGQNYVVLNLDTPISVGGQTFTSVYYGHLFPLVADGQHVNDCQPVASAGTFGQGNASSEPGGFEIGFDCGGTPCGNTGNLATLFFKGLAPGTPAAGGGSNAGGNNVTTFFGDPVSPLPTGPNPGLPDPVDNRPLLMAQSYLNPPNPNNPGRNPYATQQLLHGSMKTVIPQSGPTAQSPNFAVYFMWNPQTVDYQYQFTTQVIPADLQDPTLQNQAALLLNQQITFTIFFDRTYEVGYFDKNNPTTPPNLNFGSLNMWNMASNPVSPFQMGAQYDIRAIERLIGIYDQTKPTSSTPGTGNVAPGALVNSTGTQGIPMGFAVDVALGGVYAPVFRGYFLNIQVNYTRFNINMVPVHAEVLMTLARLSIPDPQDIKAPDGASPYSSTPIIY